MIEREALQLVSDGYVRSEIAAILGLSSYRAERLMRDLHAKYTQHSRYCELVMGAWKAGDLPPPRVEGPARRLTSARRPDMHDRYRSLMFLHGLGFTEAEVAHELFMSPETIKSDLGSIRRNLGARSTHHALSLALHWGLLSATADRPALVRTRSVHGPFSPVPRAERRRDQKREAARARAQAEMKRHQEAVREKVRRAYPSTERLAMDHTEAGADAWLEVFERRPDVYHALLAAMGRPAVTRRLQRTT